MANVKVSVTRDTLTPAMRSAEAQARNLKPLMAEVSGILLDAVEENFEQEGRPPWAPLSPATLKKRGAGAKILQDSGQLAGSLEPGYDDASAWVGTNDVKATTHHFGARKGQYGESARGTPLPFGDIPARPFMELKEDGEMDILDAFQRHLFAPL